MTDEAARVLLGVISTVHGVRGEVIVRSYCEVPEDIASYGPLTSSDGRRTFPLTIRGATKKGLIARISGIGDRNAADALRGTELYVARDLLPEPDDDEVYHADLVGLTVNDQDGKQLGQVVAIQNFGAGDLIEYRRTDGRDTEFVPLDGAFVTAIDLDAGTCTVALTYTDARPEDAGD
ncbi:MAG: ribosome maturation factor RimM [Pseudomonadota bacterium]